MTNWDFPGSPVGKTPASNAGGMGSIPGGGAKIPHAVLHSQKEKDKTSQDTGLFYFSLMIPVGVILPFGL